MKKENVYYGGIRITVDNQKEWNKKLKKITSISGSVYVRENATLTAPALTNIGGFVDMRENATLTAPALTQCGSIYVRENATLNIKQLKNIKYKSVDTKLFVIESEKISKGIKIYNGYNFILMNKNKIKKETCYVAEKGNFFAHGETVRKAISDLHFKIIAEKLKKQPIKKDTIITVQYYRLITGACEMGCKSWIVQNGIKKEEMKAKNLLPLLEDTNAYGLSSFKKLIKW